MYKKKFDIMGMSCSACSAHIQDKVSKLDGVTSVNVNLLSNSMITEYNENILTENDIIDAVKSIGYDAALHTDNAKNQYEKKADDSFKKLILSVILLIPLMIIGMGHMYGLAINDGINVTLQIVLTASIIALNFKYFTSGFKGLFTLSPNMDSLIALGATASVIYSLSAVIFLDHYIHNLYFESAGMILTFVSIGKYFESKSKSKTTQAISKLMELSPDTTIVERDGKQETISTDDVAVGDIVVVKSGYRISVDGEVIDGSGFADESALTGESMPVEKETGSKVFCGTILTNGYIRIKAQKVKSDTTLSKIIFLVEDAAMSKAPIAKVADKVSKFFVPSVIAIAIITIILWNLSGAAFAASLSFAIAVLVISCPCALGLATPTAIMVGTGNAAAHGILIKSSQSLEILSKAKNVVFDKTGTITEGSPGVADVVTFSDIDKDELIKIAASIENLSEHPLAKAILVEYGSDNFYEVTNFKSTTGKGISATISGVTYYIGNKEYINLKISDNTLRDIANKGFTPLLISDGKKLLGIISVSDKIKKSSPYAIRKMNKLGIKTYMLTGDNAVTAEYVREQTGITKVYAGLLPDEKESIVRKLKESATTVMVGDGINDSPALVSADVGIAIGAGTDIAIDSADIILVRNDLSDVLTAIELSKAVLKNIKQNLFWAFIYNIICIPIAAGALYIPFGIRLSPMYATIAMSLSSICVVSNSLRLRFFKPKHKENKNMKTIIIDGMICEHCKSHVEKALNTIDGVTATVDLKNKCAKITGDVNDSVLTKAVMDAGYKVVSIN